MVVVYELNGPIRILGLDDWEALKNSWVAWKAGTGVEHLILASLTDRKRQAERKMLESEFNRHVRQAIGKPTLALEFLRQLTLCSRSTTPGGKNWDLVNLGVLRRLQRSRFPRSKSNAPASCKKVSEKP